MNLKKIKLILAPMENVTDMPFRLLCKKYGADLVCSEMISAEAIVRTKKLNKFLKIVSEEKPVSVQIFGTNSDSLANAAKLIEDYGADIIDINMGCPSHKIRKIGAGSSLLDYPEKIKKIVETVVDKVTIPVTVKIRSNNVFNNIKIIENAGASAIALHARTVGQGYSGIADINLISEVKKKLNIPLWGNGDVKDVESLNKMLEISDGAMVGRAAMTNPLIFKKFRSYLDTGKIIEISDKEKIKSFFELYELYDEIDFAKLRMIALYFVSGIDNAKSIKREIMLIKNKDELISFMVKLAELV